VPLSYRNVSLHTLSLATEALFVKAYVASFVPPARICNTDCFVNRTLKHTYDDHSQPRNVVSVRQVLQCWGSLCGVLQVRVKKKKNEKHNF
jgi:hypothetical protein